VIFGFVVRRLRWLAAIPGAAQLFDTILLSATALFDRARFRAISEIEGRVSQLPGVRRGVHRLGGIGFFFRGKECGHIHANGLLDCLVGKAHRDRLVQGCDGVTAHHVFPRSGWISFSVRGPESVERALELIQIACAYREERV
jgi:hypothetical protein